MLHGGAQRVLDRAAVEAADRLKLVERDDDLAPARRRRAAPGSANTSCASRETSRSDRTPGNETLSAPSGDVSGA